MRRDRSRAGIRIAALVWLLLSPRVASAQTLLRGVAEIQFQSLDRLAAMDDRESWGRTIQSDFSTKIRQTIDVSAQAQFTEQTVTGRPEMTRISRGSLVVAHRLFGFTASYRPITTTDNLDNTSKQQELLLSAYLQKSKLPRIAGSWTRRHVDPSPLFPGATSLSRNVSAAYDVGQFGFHAGYGDESREATGGGAQRPNQNHFNLGTTARFHWRRATGSGQYDFNQSRSSGIGGRVDLTRGHAATLNGTYQFSRTTAGSLNYSYLRTDSHGGSPSSTQNDGSLVVGHQLSRVFQVSGGGGVRTASFGQRQENEGYVSASIAADAVARPGWRVSAGASHSVNWLPGDRGRAVESFRGNTSMRLANGLDLAGDATVSYSSRPAPTPDATAAPSQVTVSSGASLRATPLRPITLNAATRTYRTGSSLFGGGPRTDSRSIDAQLQPAASFRVSGGWALSSNPGANEPDRTIERADVQWDPSRSLSASGNYSRSSGGVRAPGSLTTGSRDAYGGRVIAALTRDLRLTFQYSESDPGLSSHARQFDVTVTQRFGR